MEGSGLKAADRNGKSDPYCEFYLGDEKIFTTQVQKKTLTPKWNEVRPFKPLPIERDTNIRWFLAL